MEEYQHNLKEVESMLQSIEGEDNPEEKAKIDRLKEYYSNALSFSTLISVSISIVFNE